MDLDEQLQAPPYGSAFVRDEAGVFQLVVFYNDEDV